MNVRCDALDHSSRGRRRARRFSAQPGDPPIRGEFPMPRGDKSSYSSRQKRKAAHIEKGYERRGVS
jgi:hypothetical protein